MRERCDRSEALNFTPDCWFLLQATQKGDPVAVLKRQLEEREKQLATEQENATAAKAKLREFTKVVLM